MNKYSILKCLVRISSSTRGQIQIDLKKQVEQTWKSIGKFLSNHLSVCLVQDFGMYKVIEKRKMNET